MIVSQKGRVGKLEAKTGGNKRKPIVIIYPLGDGTVRVGRELDGEVILMEEAEARYPPDTHHLIQVVYEKSWNDEDEP